MVWLVGSTSDSELIVFFRRPPLQFRKRERTADNDVCSVLQRVRVKSEITGKTAMMFHMLSKLSAGGVKVVSPGRVSHSHGASTRSNRSQTAAQQSKTCIEISDCFAVVWQFSLIPHYVSFQSRTCHLARFAFPAAFTEVRCLH